MGQATSAPTVGIKGGARAPSSARKCGDLNSYCTSDTGSDPDLRFHGTEDLWFSVHEFNEKQLAYEAKQRELDDRWIELFATASAATIAEWRNSRSLQREERNRLTCAAASAGRFSQRCRKCLPCLRRRQRDWQERAHHEALACSSIWWTTLTLKTGAETTTYKTFQKWMKRLRKGGTIVRTGVRKPIRLPATSFRYLVVEEHGDENGRLHWHMVVFADDKFRKAHLRSWPEGFERSRKLSGKALTKYLTKYATEVGRLRASVGFGNPLACLARARPDLADEYDKWLCHRAPLPVFVRSFGGRVSDHAIARDWASVPPI